jgi:hypothetical protein
MKYIILLRSFLLLDTILNVFDPIASAERMPAFVWPCDIKNILELDEHITLVTVTVAKVPVSVVKAITPVN